jgi:hypothetical protein
MFHCAYSILVLSPLSFSSARRRKFFLCKGAWKNKTLVDLFRSMRCQKKGLTRIGTDVLSKDCIPSSQEWSESMTKGLTAIRELEQPADGTERLVTAPHAGDTASILAEFMRPLPSQLNSELRKTKAVLSIRRQAAKEQGSALSRFREREESLRLGIQEAIQTCIAANEAFIASVKQTQQVCLKLLFIFCSLKIDI